MLMISSVSINQVAEQVGIPDVVYFSKLFKKYTGITPGRFRTEFNSRAGEMEGLI